MKGIFRKILFGDAQIKEYATVNVNEIKESVYLKIGDNTIDVSQNQYLLCLEPLIFGIWLEKDKDIISGSGYYSCKMYFKHNKTILSALTLSLFKRIDENNGSLILLKLEKSRIYHLNVLKTRLLFRQFYKKPGVSFAQLKGFASAYSYPRRVRVISFRQGDYYNIFPMDLLGDISQSNKYVFGLRHSNTALEKIIETKKLVVSEVPHTYKETIYKLGSHHSAGPPPVESLPFKVINSKNFAFYVPEWADSYKEVNIKTTINLGSHMLLWGDVQNECTLKAATDHLYHIHYLLYLYHKHKGLTYPVV